MVTRSHITHMFTFLLGLSIPCSLLLHLQIGCHFDGTTATSSLTTWTSSSPRSRGNSDSIPAINFTFPSREMRLKYYMGDWYGRTLHPNDIPCDEIELVNRITSDEDVLWRASRMRHEMKYHGKEDWLIGAYLLDAYNVIRSTEKYNDDDDRWLLLHIGDSHSHSTTLPTVAKTRFSQFATEKRTGKHFFNSIIFPLEMERHFKPNDEYIQLHQQGRVTKWKDKLPILIWRGGVTGVKSDLDKTLLTTYVDGGSRIQVVKEYYNKDVSTVDVAFQEGSPTVGWAPYQYTKEANMVRASHTSMVDQMKFKYILMLEGNDIATGLKWQLASNSVVFMAKPTTVSYLMEDLLVPFVHYVPLKDDYSNLIEMVHWARRNDEKCKWISQQATLFMQKLWMSERAKRENAAIKKELGEIYQRKFGEALKSCTTNRINGDES